MSDPRIVNQPHIIGVVAAVSFVCNCGKSALIVAVGNKVKCGSCSKLWNPVIEGFNLKIEEVLIDKEKLLVSQ